MNLDEGMIPPKKRVPWWVYAAAAAVFLLAVTALTGNTSPTGPAPAAPKPGPTPSVRHHAPPAADTAAWGTAVVFLTGWTSTDPGTRSGLLDRSAVLPLAEGLAVTAPENVITDPIESVTLIAVEPYSAEYKVTFPGRDPVWLMLTNGHGDPDWLVTQIDQRPA